MYMQNVYVCMYVCMYEYVMQNVYVCMYVSMYVYVDCVAAPSNELKE